ncbi:hypothetical protein H5P28_08370 [Ruficoccus amylovorans]|uniref:GYF domain-containing protein n=1 Tax=Ruficoccus amylovorans TaxID=1804625 RepID=A0A842HFH8_9BACT|nr:hypothetical protein [Ruficoccus amylovorans]MBC2594274.1 hypothetical protein [Ruficoccus amylovorans]
MAEFYIREADSEEARGPYSPERIADLLGAGRASAATLYYDEDREDWLPLSEGPAFQAILHPEQKRVQLKARDLPPVVEPAHHEPPPVTVDEMLAAAEGKSDETRHLRARENRMGKAAALSLPALVLMLALCAFTDIFPYWDIVMTIREERTWSLLLEYPMLILGAVDLFFVLCCILSATDVFPLIRIRAMLGLGFFTYIFWAWGEFPQSLAVAVGSLSLYVCTATLNLYAMILFAILGVGSFGALAAMYFL